MSSIGPSTPAQTSALGAVQAQHAAGTSRDKQKAQAAEARRLLKDQVDLRVDGVETNTAIRKLPQHTSEQEREEHEAHDQQHSGRTKGSAKKKAPPRIDLKA